MDGEDGLLHDALVRACLLPPCHECGAPSPLARGAKQGVCAECSAPRPAGSGALPASGLPWPSPRTLMDPPSVRGGCSLVLLAPASAAALSEPGGAAAVATAHCYRAISEPGRHPDVILLLHQPAGDARVMHAAVSVGPWATPLGAVSGELTTTEALLSSDYIEADELASGRADAAQEHASWVVNLAASYDSEQRDDSLVVPALVAIAVPASAANIVSELSAAICAVAGSPRAGQVNRRFAILAAADAGSVAAELARACASELSLGEPTPMCPLALCASAAPPMICGGRVDSVGTIGSGGLYCLKPVTLPAEERSSAFSGDEAMAWCREGDWTEKHGPLPCSDWRGSWGESHVRERESAGSLGSAGWFASLSVGRV